MSDIPIDIENRLRQTFGAAFEDAQQQVAAYIQHQKREPIRTARCAIFLAEGSLDELEKMLDVGLRDWRNVILWAEYDKGAKEPQRDFLQPFTDRGSQ